MHAVLPNRSLTPLPPASSCSLTRTRPLACLPGCLLQSLPSDFLSTLEDYVKVRQANRHTHPTPSRHTPNAHHAPAVMRHVQPFMVTQVRERASSWVFQSLRLQSCLAVRSCSPEAWGVDGEHVPPPQLMPRVAQGMLRLRASGGHGEDGSMWFRCRCAAGCVLLVPSAALNGVSTTLACVQDVPRTVDGPAGATKASPSMTSMRASSYVQRTGATSAALGGNVKLVVGGPVRDASGPSSPEGLAPPPGQPPQVGGRVPCALWTCI